MNTKKQRILITGTRAPCALDLARHFHAAGHEVMSAESLKYPLCRFSKSISQTFYVPPPRQNPQDYSEALIKIIRKNKIDWLIPTCEEIYTIAKYKDRLEAICKVFCDDFDKLIKLHDKWRFMEWAKALNLQVPRTWRLESAEDFNQLVQQGLFCDLILKPVFSRFASAIHRIYKENPLMPPIIISRDCPWVAQQFLDGPHFCTYSVVQEGKIQAHATYPVNMRAGQGACIYFEPIEKKPIENWIARFVEKIQFTGQIAFDFIQDATGAYYPIECNPRATSGIHLFETDQKFDQAFLQTRSQPLVPQASTKKMIGLAMLFFGLPTVRNFKSLQKWIRSFYHARDVLFNWHDPGPFFYQGRTFLHIWKLARRTGKSLLEVTTHDIEWNGEA